MTPVLAIATVPAVLAVVNLLKDLGLPSRFGSLAAVIVGVAAAVHAKRADIVRGTEDSSAQGNGPKADGSPNESPAAPAQAALKPSGRPGSTGRLGETKGLGRTGGPVLAGNPGRIGEPGSNGKAGDF